MMRLFSNRGALALSESLALKAVSLLLALILWITILGFKREEIKKNVKLEPLLPPGVMITNNIPSFITFTLTGPRVLLKDVEKRNVPIRPDLRQTRETSYVIAISEDLIGELPSQVRVTGFTPPNVLIHLEEVVERYVPVRPTYKGNPALGYEIGQVRVLPSKVAVSGPKTLIQSLEFVGTEPVDVTENQTLVEGIVGVEVDPAQGLQLSREKVVKVRISMKKVHREE